MNRISKDAYYLNIARSVSKRSTCLKRRYGCVIVKDDEIIATGYNGSPRGELNCCDIYEECPRKDAPHNSGDYSKCSSVHAEQNAMLSASRRDMIGATMYLAGFEYTESNWVPLNKCDPCPICDRMIKNSGISKIVSNLSNLPNDKSIVIGHSEVKMMNTNKTMLTLFPVCECGQVIKDFVIEKGIITPKICPKCNKLIEGLRIKQINNEEYLDFEYE